MLVGFDVFIFNNGQCFILRFLYEDIEVEFYRSMVYFGGDCKLKRWISFFFFKFELFKDFRNIFVFCRQQFVLLLRFNIYIGLTNCNQLLVLVQQIKVWLLSLGQGQGQGWSFFFSTNGGIRERINYFVSYLWFFIRVLCICVFFIYIILIIVVRCFVFF